MDTSVVIVGIDQWEEFTFPLIESIQKHEPSVNIIVVDNKSFGRYPHGPSGHGYKLIHLDERVPYSAAINLGMEVSSTDWTIVLNNDVLCQGPFIEQLEWMNSSALYGNQLIVFKGFRWLGLWLFAISEHVWDMVGRFDEQFEVCGFDDADFCIRAQHLGISIEKCNLPFKHFWGKTRWGIPGYPEIRAANKIRLEEKHKIKIGEHEDWKVFN
jgi:GT2 family glycosyltransferase